MTSNLRSTDDRQTQDSETLCALFDGQLRGDEARFALKRLGHDVQWRQAMGRWQLYGDTLRGQSHGLAAGGFAERVALAIQQESMTQRIVVPSRAAGGRRGWIGGALAASVAVAALFVTRPFSNDAPSTSDPAAATQVASAPAATVPPTAVATTPTPVPAAPAAPTPDRTLGLSAAAVAAVEVPRRATERRSTRSQTQRAALRANRQGELPVAVASAGATQTAVADAVAQPSVAPKPFQPQHVEPASRPWPRAVLPQYSGNGAMTASFEAGSSTSPSFYPFEPQTAAPASADAPADREPLH